MSLTCDRSVVFSMYFGFLPQENLPPGYSWNIVESGVKHHNPPFLTLYSVKWNKTIFRNSLTHRSVYPTLPEHSSYRFIWRTILREILFIYFYLYRWFTVICFHLIIDHFNIINSPVRPHFKSPQYVWSM